MGGMSQVGIANEKIHKAFSEMTQAIKAEGTRDARMAKVEPREATSEAAAAKSAQDQAVAALASWKVESLFSLVFTPDFEPTQISIDWKHAYPWYTHMDGGCLFIATAA